MKVQRKKYLKAISDYGRRKDHRTLGECLYFEFKLYRLADTRNIRAKTGEHSAALSTLWSW